MKRFLMFGNYSTQALNDISAQRTGKANEIIGRHGGEVDTMYALLGEYDLVLIVRFPGIEQAMMASAGLTKLTGISFSTSPAITIAEFDEVMTEV